MLGKKPSFSSLSSSKAGGISCGEIVRSSYVFGSLGIARPSEESEERGEDADFVELLPLLWEAASCEVRRKDRGMPQASTEKVSVVSGILCVSH